MELNEENVAACYGMAREFLKNGAKAYNKRYDEKRLPHQAAMVDVRRRAVLESLPFVRNLKPKPSFLSRGNLMRETGNTFGNCADATAVAASYFNEHMPDVKTAIASAPEPTDHAFLIVGQDAAKGSIWDLKRVSSKEAVYAVDVWAGVCCHVNQYPDRLERQMAEWEKDDKLIVASEGDVRPSKWGKIVLASSWELTDPRMGLTHKSSHELLEDLATLKETKQKTLDERKNWLDSIRAHRKMIADQPEEYLDMVYEDAVEKLPQIAKELREARSAESSIVQGTVEDEGYRLWRGGKKQELRRLHDVRGEIEEDPDGFLKRRQQDLATAESREAPVIEEGQRLLWEMDSRRHAPGTPRRTVASPGPKLQPSRLQVQEPSRQHSAFRRFFASKPTSPRPTAKDGSPILRRGR